MPNTFEVFGHSREVFILKNPNSFFACLSAPMMPKVDKKNIPQPSNPLKSFNWSKLPEAKVQGTIWSELDDSKLYSNIDLESIDKLFSAYQKNGVMVSANEQ